MFFDSFGSWVIFAKQKHGTKMFISAKVMVWVLNKGAHNALAVCRIFRVGLVSLFNKAQFYQSFKLRNKELYDRWQGLLDKQYRIYYVGHLNMPFPLSDNTREAIQHHFRRKKLVWSEAYFLEVLANSVSKYDIYWAVVALRDCGTLNSISALKAKLFYPMQDVKCCSILTIAHIAGPEETSLYAELLASPEYKDKGYAMWAIKDAADSKAIDSVLAYFKKNRAKLKSGKLTNGTLVDGLIYLQKYLAKNESVNLFFSEVKDFFGNLAQGERSEIAKHVCYFSTMANDAQTIIPPGCFDPNTNPPGTKSLIPRIKPKPL